ncbi:hypothetical protein J2Z53_001018 [Clostridium moniliforme]|uniref:DUF3867 domain-containing protein n=1 Tax=Clostridium moniliforme TaxID=39489 RepID=A0ABS4EZK9_9CLOT|nr:DUF3867 domain-containing protein [Clostridium moniliforme]MBP1889437.1 hypothetical protein [Clostridium moniliforme]
MSDKRVIDFNELKNRVNEKDIDKFEEYMYDLLYKTQTGQMTLGDFSANLSKYMVENNISQKKLFEIQKKVMERYGFDPSGMEESLKGMGIDLDSVDLDSDYEMLRKKASFQEKYNKKVVTKPVDEYFIENANNKVKIILDKEKVVLISEGNIDLNDNELNEFLCSYKKMVDGDVLKITICKNSNVYDY